jgi:hypothetical protein
LQDEPSEELALGRSPTLPNRLHHEQVDHALKLGAIGRSRLVFSIGGEFPLDVIFGVLIKVYLIDQSPKFDELTNMIWCGDLMGVKLNSPILMSIQPQISPP